MRHQEITNVIAKIICGRQVIGLELERAQEVVFLSPEQVYQNTNIGVDEVELLIGSEARIDFYKKGEKMFSKKICQEDYNLVKEYYISLAEPIEILRKSKAHQLKGFKKIIDVYSFVKNDKNFVCLVTEDSKVHVTLNQITSLTHIDTSELTKIIGSFVMAEYFESGDQMKSGSICNKSGRIMKDYSIRLADKLENLQKKSKPAWEPKTSYEDILSEWGLGNGRCYACHGSPCMCSGREMY